MLPDRLCSVVIVPALQCGLALAFAQAFRVTWKVGKADAVPELGSAGALADASDGAAGSQSGVSVEQ